MKKKITLSATAFFLIMAALILIVAPMPKAEAASLNVEQILEVLNDEQTAVAIEEILKAGTEIKQGNTDTLKNIVFKKAMEEAGISGPVNKFIIDNAKDIGEDIKSGNVANAAVKVVENAVREKIKARLSEYLVPYQDKLLILDAILKKEHLIPQIVRQSGQLSVAPQNYKKIINMSATAYAPGFLDNGIWNDKTYTGGKVKKGIAAVDPNVIPMGTKLYIEGYGHALANDQGSAIVGNRIDLAFDERNEALTYGIQDVKVYILE